MLKRLKSANVDGTTGEMLNAGCGLNMEQLCSLFNMCMKFASIPECV